MPHSVRLQLEPLEDRAAPSALSGAPWADFAPRGDPQAALVAVAGMRHAVPIRIVAENAADIDAMTVRSTGVASHLGRWTAEGRIDEISLGADQVALGGSLTAVAANGDKLFVDFTASWRISTGVGEQVLIFTGGTGRFAGASGDATLACLGSGDPATLTFECNGQGSGTLILPRRS